MMLNNWTPDEIRFVKKHYLRMSNEELSAALGKPRSGAKNILFRLGLQRKGIKARMRTWNREFGCQVTKTFSDISQLAHCESWFQKKGVPYIIAEREGGYAIFRENMGKPALDGEEPPHKQWVKGYRHPLYGGALPP